MDNYNNQYNNYGQNYNQGYAQNYRQNNYQYYDNNSYPNQQNTQTLNTQNTIKEDKKIKKQIKKQKKQDNLISPIVFLIVFFVVVFVLFTDNPFAHIVQDKIGIDFYVNSSSSTSNNMETKDTKNDFNLSKEDDEYTSNNNDIGKQANSLDANVVLTQKDNSNNQNTNRNINNNNGNSIITQNENGEWVERTYYTTPPTYSNTNNTSNTTNTNNNNQTQQNNNTKNQTNTQPTSNQETIAPIVIEQQIVQPQVEQRNPIIIRSGEDTTQSPTTPAQPTTNQETTVPTTNQETYEINDDAYANASSVAGQYESVRNELLSLINQTRAENGLGEVSLSSTLSNMAGYRVYDMGTSNYFSHSKDGISQLRVVMYAYDRMGIRHYENLGRAINEEESYLASSIMKGWKSSSSHYGVIINGDLTQIGIAIYNANGTWYVCTVYS